VNNKLLKYVTNKFVKIAEDLMQNPQGLKYKLEKAKEKINRDSVKEALGVYVDDMKTLIRMLKTWLTRSYTGMSAQTILYTVVAVIYFLTPTDFIPDFLLGPGFLDDMAVIAWVLDLIKVDLAKFKEWEEGRKRK